jgi:hypothetical protein
VTVPAPVAVRGGVGLPETQEETLTDAVELCEGDGDPVTDCVTVVLAKGDPVTEDALDSEDKRLGDPVREAVCEPNVPVAWPLAEAAPVRETVTEEDRELLTVPVDDREPLGHADCDLSPVLEREGEGDPVTVLPL